MKNSRNSICSFVLMLLLTVLFVTVAIFGVNSIGLKSAFDENAINKGLDLAGGLSITYNAYPEEGKEADLAKVETIFRLRLDSLNYSEATITTSGNNVIRIEVPGVEDHEEAMEILGATAKLQFVNASTGKVYFEGDCVASASAAYGSSGNAGSSPYYVKLEFTEEGTQLFGEATAEVAAQGEGNNFLDIVLDDEVISHASVEQAIYDSSCTITGPDFTEESSARLASLIDAGSLPVELEVTQSQYVEASLGNEALDTSIFAAAIGILIVMLFMILVYRLPGFVSAIALVGYIAIFVILIVFLRVNLSLPGIAGIILTIGMAVDANVIIYERIKEELNSGASVRSAVKAGFKGATSAIIDSNVTTLIAAVVLVVLGTGTVYGFGITLLLGTLISMFTALVVTRVFLNSLANMGVGAWIMGGKRSKDAE